MRKKLLQVATLSLASLTLIGAGLPLHGHAEEDVIATIGEKQVTKDDFYKEMKDLAGETTLRSIILENVLAQNVDKPEDYKKAAEEEVQKQIDEAGGEDVFNQLLAYQQLGSIDEFKYQVYIKNMFQDVIKQHVDMSDQAIQDYYDNSYEQPMEAQHILVETEDEAKDVIKRLNDGEEFDALAKELSLDSTAQNGGLLSPFTSGQMVPEFEEAVKGQKNGEFTQEPVKSEYGFHIIKTINNGEKKPLDEVRDQVEDQYLQAKFSDSQFSYGIVGQLIDEMGVEIKDDDLKDTVKDLIEMGKAGTEEGAGEETGQEAGSDQAQESNQDNNDQANESGSEASE